MTDNLSTYGTSQNPTSTISNTQPSIAGISNKEDSTSAEIAPLASSQQCETGDPPLSKNEQKRRLKKQKWEEMADDRKAKRKIKVVEKRERKRARREEAEAKGEPIPEPARGRTRAQQLPITIVIDCDFDDLMRDNERVSLGAQITRSYSDNKNATYKAHLTISSFGGKLKERFDGVFAKHYESWRGVRFLTEDFVEAGKQAQGWMKEQYGGKLVGTIFGKYAESEEATARAKEQGETIYLSSESENVLTDLKPFSTYIIGGLVDKNREKGICHKRATEKGVKTARLPIGDYLEMASRKVLATNHVNEIMVKYLECGDWGEAFIKVIPKRKGGQLKGSTNESEKPEDETELESEEPEGREYGSEDVVEDEQALGEGGKTAQANGEPETGHETAGNALEAVPEEPVAPPPESGILPAS